MLRRCLLLIGAVSLSGCGPEMPAPGAPRDLAVFEPDTLAVGDSVLGFRVNDLAFRRAFGDSAWVGSASFEGEARVSGEYATHFDCPGLPEACIPCFYVDSTSAQRLPRVPDDERYTWFCFTNPAEVEAAMGEAPVRRTAGGRRAEIVIRHYDYRFSFTDVYNSAEFARELRAP